MLRRTVLAAVVSASVIAAALLAAAPPRAVGEFDEHADVGDSSRPGSAEYDAARREYRVTGSGENMWGKADMFHFVSRKASGDVTIGFDVRFVGEGKVAHRKACGMVRQGLAADDAYADVAIHGDGLISLQYRRTKGGITEEVKSPVKGPATVRLERKGNAFTLSVTPAGKETVTVGPVTLALKDPVYVGLAVCSHDVAVSETAVFSNVGVRTSAPR
jgi:hypothetical protein